MSTTDTPRSPQPPQRLLLLAGEAVAGETVREVVARFAGAPTEVLVVAPAPRRRIGWRTSDDRPTRAAEKRIERCLGALRAAGIDAEGLVGDGDPLVAIHDALRLFPADSVVIAPHPRSSVGDERKGHTP